MARATVVLDAGIAAVGLAAAKEHLAVLHTLHEGKIGFCVGAAEETIQDMCEIAITEKTYAMEVVGFAEFVDLNPWNATSVVSVEYVDVYGARQTLPVTDYRLERGHAAAIVFRHCPQVQAGSVVTITFKAGWPAEAIPKKIQQGILMLVSTFYDNDSDVVIGRLVSELPLTVEKLLSSYRLMRVG